MNPGNYYDRFYERLFAPVIARVGPKDPFTISAVIGFSAGGPVSVSTFPTEASDGFVTYATCELVQYPEQGTEVSPPFELVLTANDRDFAISLLTSLGALSMETNLGHHHTIDVSSVVSSVSTVSGVLLERLAEVEMDGRRYALLQVVGLSKEELLTAQRKGADYVLDRLRTSGVYPRTPMWRDSVV